MTPPSLRRRAPGQVKLADDAGRCPQLCFGLLHLRAGQKLCVEVAPQVPAGGQPAAAVKIVAGEALTAIVSPPQVPEATGRSCYAELRARLRSRWPLPRKAVVHISVADGTGAPFTLALAFAVWPSVWRVLLWGLGAVVVAIVSARFLERARTHSPAEAVVEVGQDWPFLGQAVALGLGIAALIRVLGWVAVGLGMLSGDDE